MTRSERAIPIHLIGLQLANCVLLNPGRQILRTIVSNNEMHVFASNLDKSMKFF